MAKEIRLDQIGDHMYEQVETLLRKTVLEADKQLKMGSPVDTGRLRISWQSGENANSSQPAKPGKYQSAITPLKGYNYTAGNEKLGNYYSIHNNVEYAEPVLMGTNLPPSWGEEFRSKDNQVIPGYPDLVAKELGIYVKAEYERIKRQG